MISGALPRPCRGSTITARRSSNTRKKYTSLPPGIGAGCPSGTSAPTTASGAHSCGPHDSTISARRAIRARTISPGSTGWRGAIRSRPTSCFGTWAAGARARSPISSSASRSRSITPCRCTGGSLICFRRAITPRPRVAAGVDGRQHNDLLPPTQRARPTQRQIRRHLPSSREQVVSSGAAGHFAGSSILSFASAEMRGLFFMPPANFRGHKKIYFMAPNYNALLVLVSWS